MNAGAPGAGPGRRRDRRRRRPGRYLPRRRRLLLHAGEDPGPVQAAALAQPGRPAADRRAVHPLGARRRRLSARGQPRDAGPGAGHAGVARTLHRALRDQRRQAGQGGPRRPPARRRRRRRSRRPQPAARRPPARNPAQHPPRPSNRTDQQRRIPARRRPRLPRPSRRLARTAPALGAIPAGVERLALFRRELEASARRRSTEKVKRNPCRDAP